MIQIGTNTFKKIDVKVQGCEITDCEKAMGKQRFNHVISINRCNFARQ